MAAPTIFARVTPKSIKISETYIYEATFSRTCTVQGSQQESPNVRGELVVTVPYDGARFFTKSSLEDIQRQLPKGLALFWLKIRQRLYQAFFLTASAQTEPAEANRRFLRVRKVFERLLKPIPATHALIGHLGFSAYHKTDLAKVLRVTLNDDTFPLAIPFSDDRWTKLDDLLTTAFEATLTQPYTPRPAPSPLRLTFQLHDERAFHGQIEKVWDQLPPAYLPLYRCDSPEVTELCAIVSRQESFEPTLLLDFGLTVTLDRTAADGVKTLKLERLALNWPTPITQRRVGLQSPADGQPHSLPPQYDALTKTIFWKELPLQRKSPTPEQKTIEFTTDTLQLSLAQPGQLYRQQQLTGSVVVKLPILLSGVQATFYDATGRRGDIAPTYESKVKLNFSLDLLHALRCKRYAPYQHLQYDGVILNERRLGDAENILEDLGFTVRSCALTPPDNLLRRYLVMGQQRHGDGLFWLVLLLDGRTMNMQRNRSLATGHGLATMTETGVISVYMRAQLQGDHTALLATMNEVQQRFERLFTHISTVD